ncbi:RuvB-like protein 2 [Nematocida displodere]|uniref:RuvB-like helicase n=1 Tax=Nematocida displodere TaxID=1805483 RepID=A0A177EIU3_9MICR|nr:RuvB-like protein 2 [Nematocida displodere]
MIERISANTLSQIERIGAHSHILGLGIDENMNERKEDGLVGHYSQRKALYLVNQMVQNTPRGRILLAGPCGTGKSALVSGFIKELEKTGIPHKLITASEIYSSSLSKTELLTQAIREALGIEVKESSRVLEGEVVDIQVSRETGRTGSITLKTTETEGVFTLGEKMVQNLYQERVEAGDVIRVNKTTGVIKKLGRSLSKAKDYESIGPYANFVPCPEGELLSVREERHTVTFHDIDIINSKTQGYLSLMNASAEIPAEIRENVDATMREWVEEGRGVLRSGVLFINESHMLDAECYSFLNLATELRITPLVVLSTSKEHGPIRGTEDRGRYAIPGDFLSRTLVIKTNPYSNQEMEEIVRNRAGEENVAMEEEGLGLLVELAIKYGIRYGFNLLSAADIIAQRTGRPVRKETIASLAELFVPEQECIQGSS